MKPYFVVSSNNDIQLPNIFWDIVTQQGLGLKKMIFLFWAEDFGMQSTFYKKKDFMLKCHVVYQKVQNTLYRGIHMSRLITN